MRNSVLIVFLAALALCLVFTGCSKKDSNSTAPSPGNQPATPALDRAESDALYQARDLQLSVEAYEKLYKRKPASLEQLVREGFLASLPAAPPGKRFALDPATSRVTVVPQ